MGRGLTSNSAAPKVAINSVAVAHLVDELWARQFCQCFVPKTYSWFEGSLDN